MRHRSFWATLGCTTCKRKTKASKWTCTCNLLWVKCPEHFWSGLQCRGRPRTPLQPGTASQERRAASAGQLGDPERERYFYLEKPAAATATAKAKPKPVKRTLSNATDCQHEDPFAGSRVLQQLLQRGLVCQSLLEERRAQHATSAGKRRRVCREDAGVASSSWQ